MGLCQSKNEELSMLREQVVMLSNKLDSISHDLKYIKNEIENWYGPDEDTLNVGDTLNVEEVEP